MMQDKLDNFERVSAMVDGQLQGDEFDQAAAWAARNLDGQTAWRTYHVVGEVLRTGEATAAARDADFMARFKLQLQREPVLPRPVQEIKLIAIPALDMPARGHKVLKMDAANDATFRWKRVAGFASVVAVVAVGFMASGLWDAQRGGPQLAQATLEAAQPSLLAASGAEPLAGPPVMLRDSELDALLAAHRQFGGTTALQVPTGFLRNATFEGSGR